MPLVSVIMSVYNGEQYLKEAIESILNQTFTDYEFLIMDDDSDDQTLAILQEYSLKDGRIKTFFHKNKNKGLGESLNFLIKVSRGEFIARMDADDISEPERLAVQVDYLKNHPEHAFVVGGSLVTDSKGQVISGKFLKDRDAELRKILLSGEKNPFTHGAIMFRKLCLLNLSMIYRFRYSQDFDLLLRLAGKHKIGANESILYRYRQGSGLQNDYVKARQRLEQRKKLLNIYRDGMLYDDDFCREQVAQIYLDGYNFKQSTMSRLAFGVAQSRIELKSNFLKNEFGALRKLAIKSMRQYGCKKIYLAYLIISFLPLRLTMSILDLYDFFRNRKSGSVIVNLSFKELSLY